MSVWDSDNLGHLSQKICWALFGGAAITVAMRIYCRVQYSPRHGGGLFLDDLATVGCLAVLLTFCILLSVAVGAGVGSHYDTLSSSARVEALRWNAILTAVTPWVCTLPKFAIIMTLNRILAYGHKTTLMLWGLAVSSQVLVAVLSIWDFAQCRPVAYQWEKASSSSSSSAAGGSCASANIYLRLAWATYVYSTALDIFFALFPVPFVMRLKIPLKTRIGVSISLSISLVGFAISIYKFSIMDIVGYYYATDPSFPMVYLCMTHAAEGSFLIMSTSLATLRPLYRGLKRHVASRTFLNSTPLSNQLGSGSGSGTRGLTQRSGGGGNGDGDGEGSGSGGGGGGRWWSTNRRMTTTATAMGSSFASSRGPPSSICRTNYDDEDDEDDNDLEAHMGSAAAVPVVVVTAAAPKARDEEDRLLQQPASVPTSKFNTQEKASSSISSSSSKECLDITILEEAAKKGRAV